MVTTNQARREAVFRSLADPTRRRILQILRGGDRTVGDLAGHFRVSRPAISKHLRVLEAARLVVARQQGAARLCALNAKPLRLVNDWLRDYEAYWGDTLGSLKRYVEEGRR
ncbi:MAG TPA: metalloregulator ArsR/SmtB family transcription factor [Myxococcales bacterium]|nr:metalloregulator ArsR/SmtB family transcription factor [Myxococcales bacterium]